MGVIWAAQDVPGCPGGDKGMSLLLWAKHRSHSGLEQPRIRQQSCQRGCKIPTGALRREGGAKGIKVKALSDRPIASVALPTWPISLVRNQG